MITVIASFLFLIQSLSWALCYTTAHNVDGTPMIKGEIMVTTAFVSLIKSLQLGWESCCTAVLSSTPCCFCFFIFMQSMEVVGQEKIDQGVFISFWVHAYAGREWFGGDESVKFNLFETPKQGSSSVKVAVRDSGWRTPGPPAIACRPVHQTCCDQFEAVRKPSRMQCLTSSSVMSSWIRWVSSHWERGKWKGGSLIEGSRQWDFLDHGKTYWDQGNHTHPCLRMSTPSPIEISTIRVHKWGFKWFLDWERTWMVDFCWSQKPFLLLRKPHLSSKESRFLWLGRRFPVRCFHIWVCERSLIGDALCVNGPPSWKPWLRKQHLYSNTLRFLRLRRQFPIRCFHVQVCKQSSIGDVFVLSVLGVSVVLDQEGIQGFHVQGSGESSNENSSLQVQNRCHSHTEHKREACKKSQSASNGGGKANLACMEQGNLREKGGRHRRGGKWIYWCYTKYTIKESMIADLQSEVTRAVTEVMPRWCRRPKWRVASIHMTSPVVT